jgi:hypothetical protein
MLYGWEYKVIERQPGVQLVADRENVLNHFGREGWENYAVEVTPQGGRVYYFKRVMPPPHATGLIDKSNKP